MDTHAWLWALLGHARLGAAARRVLAKVGDDEPVGLAARSLNEAAWLLARGRVSIVRDPSAWAAWLRDAASAPGLEVLPLTVEVASESELAQALPRCDARSARSDPRAGGAAHR